MGKMMRLAIAGLVAVNVLALAPHAMARSDDRVVRRGRCTGASVWKLKAQPEDRNRLEVEFEVDVNRNGHTWKVVLRDNGVQVASGFRLTRAPSGSFEFRKLIPNRPGTDTIRAIGRSLRTGEVCRGTVSI